MSGTVYNIIKIIRFLKDNDVKITRKLLFLVPVVYLLFPFDFVVDFFPLAGQIDDVAVFVLMWPILRTILSNYDKGNIDPTSKKKQKDSIDIDQDDYNVE